MFQEFIEEIEMEELLFDKLAGAISIIEHSSNLIRLPASKFRIIIQNTLPCKVYEAKSGMIRVYLFHEENTGRIIITGGKKENQKKDIRFILNIIRQYYHDKQ